MSERNWDWDAELPYWVRRIKILEAENARLRAVAEAAKRYLAVKKSWDNRLPELKALRQAIEEADRDAD